MGRGRGYGIELLESLSRWVGCGMWLPGGLSVVGYGTGLVMIGVINCARWEK